MKLLLLLATTIAVVVEGFLLPTTKQRIVGLSYPVHQYRGGERLGIRASTPLPGSKSNSFGNNHATPKLPNQEQSPLLQNLYHKLRGGGSSTSKVFVWTASKILRALVIFIGSGLAEIGGGWLVWKALREGKPWYWALWGSFALVGYGILPTLQPTDSFGRIYAVYGGFFIFLSYLWGYVFDGLKLDAGDVIGGVLALLAVLVILFWPRKS